MRGTLTAVVLLSVARIAIAQRAIDLSSAAAPHTSWHVVNRAVSSIESGGRRILHFEEKAGGAVAWTNGVDFSDGDIDVDLRGRDVFQKSFLGIAFHVESDSAFDVVYLRPFNYQSTDSVRHAHAVQYMTVPEFPWERLRVDRPGRYEASMPAGVDPNAWTHVKLSIHGRDLKVFVNAAAVPVLHVQTLANRTHGGIGVWVGDLSPADFAGLTVTPAGGGKSGQ